MNRRSSPLLKFLADADAPRGMAGEEWSLLFAEARAAGVLFRVATHLDRRGLVSVMPVRFRAHVLSALREGEALICDARREIGRIRHALREVAVPVLLLKGGAYVAASLPSAEGREFSDVDILVDRCHIADVESALLLGGWRGAPLDEYDQRYYREWAHEIPPVSHLERGTTVDLHHSLVMPTCRIRVDSAEMVRAAIPIPNTGWHRLCDEDIVLHAASHLMLNSEFDKALRDLWDIDLMVRHFAGMDPEFPERIGERARRVGLAGLFALAINRCNAIFGTPVPRALLGRNGGITAWLFSRAAHTRHPETRPSAQGIANSGLMVRELWLRFPPHLMLRHLVHKAAKAIRPKQNENLGVQPLR